MRCCSVLVVAKMEIGSVEVEEEVGSEVRVVFKGVGCVVVVDGVVDAIL